MELQLQWTQSGHGCESPSQVGQAERLCNNNVVILSCKPCAAVTGAFLKESSVLILLP